MYKRFSRNIKNCYNCLGRNQIWRIRKLKKSRIRSKNYEMNYYIIRNISEFQKHKNNRRTKIWRVLILKLLLWRRSWNNQKIMGINWRMYYRSWIKKKRIMRINILYPLTRNHLKENVVKLREVVGINQIQIWNINYNNWKGKFMNCGNKKWITRNIIARKFQN